MLRNMLRPPVNEILQRALYLDPEARLFVFGPKGDASFPDIGDATLGNRRPSQVATVVAKAMVFRRGGLNLDAPPAWPDGPPVESSGDTAVFPEINRLRPYYTTLIIVFNILQASIPTSGPARSIGCNLLQLKVANVFSIPLSAGC
jgi:hypothetical protein